MRTGIANLPLHSGRAPKWLFEKMVKLAREIIYLLVLEKGRKKLLENLADPFWFQAFGCILGFDWHSSGITTTVCGAIKEALKDIGQEIGVFMVGGKGKTALKTPEEIYQLGEKFSLSVSPIDLIKVSRLTAKVDNSCLQDGFQIYHHTLIFTKEGLWGVIQQGMNPSTGWARRYHWLHGENMNFVDEPHSGIISDWRGKILNLVAKESEGARKVITEISKDSPDKVWKELKEIKELTLPSHHWIRGIWIDENHLKKSLEEIYSSQPENFEDLLLIKGVGAKTLRALALISELLYGEKVSRRDPARYSFAHGGKDGHPYPVDKKTYQNSIEFLKEAINKAKLGNREKLNALKRLSLWSERL